MPCQGKPGWLRAGTFTWKQFLFSEIPTQTGQRNRHMPKWKHSLTFIGLNHTKVLFFLMQPLGLIIILRSLSFTILDFLSKSQIWVIFDFLSIRLWLGLGDMLSFQVVPANCSLLWGKAMIRDSQTHILGRLDTGFAHLERKSLISAKGSKFMISGTLHSPPKAGDTEGVTGHTTSTALPHGVCERPGNWAATSSPLGINREKYGNQSAGKGGR